MNSQERVMELKNKIEAACIESGLNLTIYDGKIGFVDQQARKIVAVWEPEYSLPQGASQTEQKSSKGLKLFEAILHTGGVTAEQLRAEFGDVSKGEIENYRKILNAMDGQKAIVSLSFVDPEKYDYLGLLDPAQDKEVAYLMEQDPMMGCYIENREDFDRDYDSGDYCPDGIWTLKKEYVEIVKPISPKAGEVAQGG